jgi:hypothetical protein
VLAQAVTPSANSGAQSSTRARLIGTSITVAESTRLVGTMTPQAGQA